MECEEQEIKLSDIVAVFKKQWRFILLPSLLAVVIAAGFIIKQPQTYESYSLIRIGGSQSKLLENIGTINSIMQTYPMREAIFNKLKLKKPLDTPEDLEDVIQYDDVSGLLKVHTIALTPEKASELVTIATEMILARHQQLFENTKNETNGLFNYFRNTVKPMSIIATSIVEFRLTPTLLEIPTVVSNKPVVRKNKAVPVTAFFLVFFIMTLIAFYRQSSADVVQPPRQS